MAGTEFIGRHEDLTFLENWLSNRTALSTIYIHDALEEKDKKGGTGKTSLLREFHKIIKVRANIIAVHIDFFNVLDRNSVVIAERVVQAVKEKYPHWNPERFENLHQRYLDAATKQKTEAFFLRDQLADALVDDLRLIQQEMVKSNTYIVLFFDTYELIERNPKTAVLRPTQTFPENYQSNRVRLIIAGRNAIDWKHQNWIGREKEVIVRVMQPFNEKETLQYLDNRSRSYDITTFAEETKHALYQRTDGRPILVGLVSDVLNGRIKDAVSLARLDKHTFEASLVANINSFDDISQRAIFAMAHIYHRFDASFLSALMNWSKLQGQVPEIEYQALAKKLSTLSFVRSTGNTEIFVLHDEMRRLINKYCCDVHDPNGKIRRNLSKFAIDYYTNLIANEQDEEKQQSYIVERLYHELYVDLDAGYRSFEQHLNEALDFAQRNFARALLQELQKFEDKFSQEQKQDLYLAEVRVLREEEDPETALAVLSTLDQTSQWAEQHRSDLLFETGHCYQQLSQYPPAIDCFKACLQIEEGKSDKTRLGLLLNRLGYINRIQGNFDEALLYFQEALEVERTLDNQGEYANLLNNIGNVLRLQGKYGDALRYCKRALHIRRGLVKQGKISAYYLGLSLSTLGHIYHDFGETKEEEQAYQEAFDIYSLLGEKSAIANTHNRLGRIWINKSDFKKAEEEFQRALHITRNSTGIHREAEIESYNQLGRLFLLKENWQEAVQSFHMAIARARQVGQNLDMAENLLSLADALDHTGESSHAQIEEAEKIASQHKYTFLLGRVKEVQGDIHLRRQEYIQAFRYYEEACYYMALRGRREYEKIVRKLYDILLDIPGEFLPDILNEFQAYWKSVNLDTDHPEIPEMCKEICEDRVP